MSATWHVYLLDCDGASLYTGVTTDVERRLGEHRAGAPRAARYTRSRRRIELAHAVEVGGKSLAMRVEYRLRRLPAPEKRRLAEQRASLAEILQRLNLD